MQAVNFLTALSASGKTDYFQIARQFVSKYPQRGLLIIISDFLDEQDPGKPLQFFSDFGHEIQLVHLWAEEDRVPPWEGQLDLHDAETGDKIEITFDDAARDCLHCRHSMSTRRPFSAWDCGTAANTWASPQALQSRKLSLGPSFAPAAFSNLPCFCLI